MNTIDLNCDLGERDDADGVDIDLALLNTVTSANIACGGHAGDEASMERTVIAALKRGVAIGAHPSYPDRNNFGRVTMSISSDRLEAEIAAQLENLNFAANRHGASLVHLKPHGALYHDAMYSPHVAESIARALMNTNLALILVGMAGSPALELWKRMGFRVAAEGFADRRYQRDGSPISRSEPDALLDDPADAAAQAIGIAKGTGVRAASGELLEVHADTICIHSDTPHAVQIALAVREALQREGLILRALSG